MWTFKAEVSYAAHSTHHQGVNDIFALKSITVSSFSLYYTWHNDLRLYNRMILTVIIIMFTLRALLSFETLGFWFGAVARQIKVRGPQMTTVPLKWTLLLYSTLTHFTPMFHFIPPENIWFSKVFKGYRNRKKEFSLDIEF